MPVQKMSGNRLNVPRIYIYIYIYIRIFSREDELGMILFEDSYKSPGVFNVWKLIN